MAGPASRPGRAAFILILVVAAVLAYLDLSSSRSILRGLWHTVFPVETRGQEMRDNLLHRVNPRR